ncbi:lipocalin family protein [Mucilaginibacter sp. RS28]|uniref:Lipocalin family protein n=1 Tax=Mucilaginibacter straminoryzae TaxID=2932774 RepID=A0A9X1X0P3_9SPHI|nr:lipocalin family protein [Mucilaginibacter straminoryzae]MCJ8208883.1 lipocalin family protein [Mucilaginibacter straminoryzae]
MKRIVYISLLLAATLVTACKKEKNNPEPASILGKWVMKSYRVRVFDANNILTVDSTHNVRNWEPVHYYKFESDGTGTEPFYGYPYVVIDHFNYSYNNNIIQYYYPPANDLVYSIKVTSLTSNTLDATSINNTQIGKYVFDRHFEKEL